MAYSRWRVIGRVPGLGLIARVLGRGLRRTTFPGSAAYWERRYKQGGTSGAGSYGDLAKFKAEVLNALVANERIQTVIEFGCGDGNQLSLARYPRYLGLDVSRSAVELCIGRFADDTTKSFALYDPIAFRDRAGFFRADLTMSLDIVYHLVEDAVFETHMRQLFGSANRLVVIYSSNSTAQPANPHVRHRRFTDWVDQHERGWTLRERIPNRFPIDADAERGSGADFFVYERRA